LAKPPVHRKPKHEAVAKQEPAPLPRKAPPAQPERVAQAEPPPAPAPAARKPAGDPLLDVGDDELEKELSSSKPKRSVYVPPAPGADLPENVSVSQINEAVMGQKTALVRCIEQQRAADPDAKGTLKMRWLIGGDGSVRDVRVLSDEFSRQPISPCITGVVKSLRFPRSRTTGQEVVFPFKF
ncbi:MAG TPA: AgmX/PglI C-terminal domain-containing protein, partial [Anaeromyxobacteraceae bacterium]|nr:AgmX/PglI C-terminal domain-containing protein [Anaeromyxobacteraceae bacterium]